MVDLISSNNRMRVDWSRLNKKETEEAKEHYRSARRQNRTILNTHGQPIDSFKADLETFIIAETQLDSDQFALHVLDESGDRRLIWRLSDPDEIKEAQEIFNQYIQKGWKAYGVNDDGSRSRRIREFDATSEELVFDDKSGGTVREKFQSFVGKFREVKMLPRTRPG